MQTPNSVSLEFHSYEEDSRDTHLNVSLNADNVNNTRLMKVLNTWLVSIAANLKVVPD
jgi:hypothetical protein